MNRFREKLRTTLERRRHFLATRQAEITLAFLGLVVGLLSGGLIISFRLGIETLQLGLLSLDAADTFEGLSTPMRFLLPLFGAVVLGVGFWLISVASRSVGIVHVLERLQYHEGHLPLRNLLVQFFGGIVALASGQSVGREGPSVHLGAGVSSLTGRYLSLPNNSIRTLVACGSAAAIAASFNTPLAGVIFAMEVIVMEYTIAGFTPVILAAVVATAMSRAVFGEETAFIVPTVGSASLSDLFYITVMGVAIGAASAAFVGLIRHLRRISLNWSLLLVMPLAGLAVGGLGIFIPEVLGTGYDSVNLAVSGQLGMTLMALILLAKFVASAICVSGRIPGGLIGPTIVMGCMAGGLFAQFVSQLPAVTADPVLYTVLGMGAMMSAALQAPLAALLALLEMTASPALIMPAMLAVVSANMAAKSLFGQRSVFLQMLQDSGMVYRSDPVSLGLRRIGVTAVMNRRVVSCDAEITAKYARQLLSQEPQWIVIRQSGDKDLLMPGSNLAAYLESESLPETIQLREVPGQRQEVVAVDSRATLYEARRLLDEYKVDAVYVRRPAGAGSYRILGVLQHQDIQASYSLR
ncbi:CIC family chloride channel protein [Methylohalomonas lacus]|uniref:CIC family chloride channel protein n=1 Tax=Methylohalomonas lacus TaxID=398773 RepID=A0AAE3HLG0_9GAMM|nr:chloride channel protein [Methylohalomonas lacus]MCS3903299.1 CIC family chloride channel protein [Methylohalomonas lacus]